MALKSWKQIVTDIADAFRSLTGYTGNIKVGELSGKVSGIPKVAAQTITPGTTSRTIAAGQYLSGTQTINGSANLISGNIKSGVSIFGVYGGLKGLKTVRGRCNPVNNKLMELPLEGITELVAVYLRCIDYTVDNHIFAIYVFFFGGEKFGSLLVGRNGEIGNFGVGYDDTAYIANGKLCFDGAPSAGRTFYVSGVYEYFIVGS